MKKNIIFCILLMVYCFNGLISHVNAESISLSISPPVTEVLIAPNKTTTTTITLKNLGESTNYQISLHKVIPTDDQGHSTIDPTPLNLNQLPLIPTLVGQEFDTPYPLATNQVANLTLQLSAPSIDVATDLYLALVIQAIDPNLSLTNSSSNPAIASLILTTITPLPAIPTDISLKKFELPTLHDSASPLTLSPQAQNNTNIMLRIQGHATLTSPSGKVIQETKLDPTLILGNSTRNLTSLSFPLALRNLGPHRLTLTLTTEGGRTLLESSSVIWILPLRAIILTIIGLLILSILNIRRNRLTVKAKKV